MAGSKSANAKSSSDVSQWIKRVRSYSSQYNESSWSANAIIGSPRVFPRYGDIHGAWAQGQCNDSQFIEVEYDKEVFMKEIKIYETLNAGAVVRLSALSPSGSWVTLWQADSPQRIQQSRIFTPPITETDFKSKVLKIDVDCSASNTWCELDAVLLLGKLTNIAPPPNDSELAEDLQSLVDKAELSNVKFIIGDKIVHGHRAILSVRCQYFRAMFCDGMKESRDVSKPIPIHGISYGAFLGLMHYIYTNKFQSEIEPNILVELLRVADMYTLEGLKRLGFYCLNNQVKVENVVDIFLEATQTMPALDDVSDMCIAFIAQNMADVSKTPNFCQLPQEVMLDIIQKTTAQLALN